MDERAVKNVLLVTFDAFRHDHLRYLVDYEAPHLRRMVDRSVIYSDHISTGSGTSTSFPGIHASALPLDYGYRGISESHHTVAEHLAEFGIRTLGVTAQSACSSTFGYDVGFDTFIDPSPSDPAGLSLSSMKHRVAGAIRETPIEVPVRRVFDRLKSHDNPPYMQADQITTEAIDLLPPGMAEDGRTFGWVHYMEPHAPYYPPRRSIEKYHDGGWDVSMVNQIFARWNRERGPVESERNEALFTEEELEVVRAFYKAQLDFGIEQFGRLIQHLFETGWEENTVVIVTADHGEEFFEHDDFGHRPKLYEELIHVPLLLSLPGNGERKHREVLTSHLDLAPTIAELFGCKPSPRWRGNSLVPSLTSEGTQTAPREYAITELSHRSGLGGDVEPDEIVLSVRDMNWKYMFDKQNGRERLFNLAEDPGEKTDVKNEHPDKFGALQNVCNERLKTVTRLKANDVAVSDDVVENLQRLGYRE